MGRSTSQERTLSEKRTYRKFSAQQKSELMPASLRGQKTIGELCREHEISETLLRRWREQFLAAGAERLSGKAERTEADELRRRRPRESGEQERHLRIRARSAPGQVAGAASYTNGLSAHKNSSACPTTFSQSPCPGTPATLRTPPDSTGATPKPILMPVHHVLGL